jgi:hypothetical protein
LHEQEYVASRESATLGLVASLASRQAAVKGARAVSDYSALRMGNSVAFECLECSEPRRIGVSHKSSSNVIRSIMEGSPSATIDAESLWLNQGSWKLRHPSTKALLLLDTLMTIDGDIVIVLDGAVVRYCAKVMIAHVFVKEGNKTWTWTDAPNDVE